MLENRLAGIELAGAGDGLTANLHRYETGNGGDSQWEPPGYRASPRPYYAPPLPIRPGPLTPAAEPAILAPALSRGAQAERLTAVGRMPGGPATMANYPPEA